MNYEIRVVGFRDLLRAENATELKKRWENYLQTKQDGIVEIKSAGWSGRLSDIKNFKLVTESRLSNSSFEEENKKIYQERQQVLAQTPEVRSKNMGWFRLIYWGFTSKKSEEVMIKDQKLEDLVERIQLKFFSENPKRIHCDPSLFKPVIKADEFNQNLVSLVENMIYQDKKLAR